MLQTIHLFGLGVGEVLDPLNDLVERFSSVMELAIASLVIQKVLLEITASLFFKLVLTVSGGLLIFSLYVRTGLNTLLLSRVFMSMVFLRFSIALAVMLNGIVASAFVTDKINADVKVIEQVEKSAPPPEPTADDVADEAPAQIEETPSVEVPPQANVPPALADPLKKSWFSKLKEMGAKGAAIAKEKLKKWDPKAMKEKLDTVIPNMLNVMALFLLKSLILPLIFLYGLKYAMTHLSPCVRLVVASFFQGG